MRDTGAFLSLHMLIHCVSVQQQSIYLLLVRTEIVAAAAAGCCRFRRLSHGH